MAKVKTKTTKAASKTTRVAVLLDRSGSMESVRDETISGFNHYLGELKKDNAKFGKCLLTLTQFDSAAVEVVHDAVEVSKVPALNRDTFVPRGMTPLYDAIGRTIGRCDGKTLFVILTDGHENASREFDAAKVKTLIAAKEADGWTFVYLGANQDAFAVGASIGVGASNAMNYATANMGETMSALSSGTKAYRAGGGARMAAFTESAAAWSGESEEKLRARLVK